MGQKERKPYEFSRLAEELIGELRGIPPEGPSRMRRRPTKGLGLLVEELLAKYKVGRSTLEDSIRAAWPDIVGQANAQYSIPVNIDEKQILHVSFSHSMVHSNLKLMKLPILEKVRALPLCSQLRDIRFRHG